MNAPASADAAAAMELLGVDDSDSWEDVRRSYRSALMAHHPDHQDGDRAAETTGNIVAAFRLLRDLTSDGHHPLPTLGIGLDVDEAAPMILHARPGDVFVRLCQAAMRIGHLSYADHDDRLAQVIVDEGDFAPSQLTIEVTPSGAHAIALFSLEPLGTGTAPPIQDVVDNLAAHLRAAAPPD